MNNYEGICKLQEWVSDLVSGNQSQIGTMLQEHIPGTLSRIDADAIVRQDGTRLGIHLELLCCIFDYSCKWGILWYFDTVWWWCYMLIQWIRNTMKETQEELNEKMWHVVIQINHSTIDSIHSKRLLRMWCQRDFECDFGCGHSGGTRSLWCFRWWPYEWESKSDARVLDQLMMIWSNTRWWQLPRTELTFCCLIFFSKWDFLVRQQTGSKPARSRRNALLCQNIWQTLPTNKSINTLFMSCIVTVRHDLMSR